MALTGAWADGAASERCLEAAAPEKKAEGAGAQKEIQAR